MDLRREWPAIADYGFLSNCRSAALVDRNGAIDWCCFQRFDQRPVFGRLLDREKGGFFRVGPVAPCRTTRRYLPDTLLLETRFHAPGGILVLTDCLPVQRPGNSHGLPRAPAGQELLVRHLRCEEGEVEVELLFAPRFDYGMTTPLVEVVAPDLAVATGGADGLLLHSDLGPLRSDCEIAHWRGTLRAGEEATVAVEWSEAALLPRRRLPGTVLRERVEATRDFWTGWLGHCSYEGPYAKAVRRSAIVLKGLTNATTGALAAAATTSLPECIGGERNWDYRYTWLRDSVAVLAGLLSLGYRHEAVEYGRFLMRTAAGEPRDMQIMYGLGGERLLHEVELGHLGGYRGSRPVRIGNGAWNQLQLDTYGEVLSAAWLFYREHLPGGLSRPSPEATRFLRAVMEQIVAKWHEPDEGMWEVRSARQHFVFSKLMCWVGLDRGVRLFEALGDERPAHWARVRDEIRATIEREGICKETGAFAQAFGSRQYDASALQVLLRGFLPPGDPRVQATIRAIEENLTRNGHVYRYHGEDGLAGREGAFTYCTLWLATAHALSGRIDEAEALFERVLASANDLGLLSEEIDPDTGELLGNFPQAFSHVGVIETAFAIDGARAGNYVAPEGPEAPCWG